MKIQNKSIYHCLTCGRVVHAESSVNPPECCGHTMTEACCETVSHGDVAGKENMSVDPTESPRSEDRQKPR